MAALAAYPAMHDAQKALHPFFSKPTAPLKHPSDDPANTSQPHSPIVVSDHVVTVTSATSIKNLVESTHPDSHTVPAEEPTATKRGRPKSRGKPKSSPSSKKNGAEQKIEAVDDTVEAQSNTRRKRRRLSHDGASSIGVEVQVPASSPQDRDVDMGGQGSEDMIIPQSSPTHLLSSQLDPAPTPIPSSSITEDAHQTGQPARPSQQTEVNLSLPSQDISKRPESPPKRMMRLKAGGRLASPVKAVATQATDEETQIKKPAKRGRKKKEKHLLVVCRYSVEGVIGTRIHNILNSEERYHLPSFATKPPPPVTTKPPSNRPKPAKPDPSKPPHPFFSGKSKPAATTTRPSPAAINLTESPRRTSAVTPGKLRAQRQIQKGQDADDDTVPLAFGNNRDRMITKQPGMRNAPWPSRGLSHIRGDFLYHAEYTSKTQTDTQPPPTLSRKMKQRVAILDEDQSMLSHYCHTLDFTQTDSIRPDGFRDPSPSLRVPIRSLISGSEIQRLVYNQLDAAAAVHPACVHLYNSIPTAMTPYDHGRSEVQAWAQKYAPACSEHVLQSGKEATILRDWMKALTVMAVNGFSASVAKIDKSELKKKKRRKKAADLDDFIVDSDEDVNDMDELAEPDDNPSSQGSTLQKRSLVQQAGAAKLSNAILISGPSGAGKSAMAYAVAKELGFEVFEINSGSRRSGKDVLDRVGDMVENHLVQRHSADNGNASADEDAGRLSEAFKADLASGRQGTMAGFFSSKPKKDPGAVKRLQPSQEPQQQKVQQTVSKAKASRSQKQSLILLEEVDILFEEDKGFWQTVFTLIINSRRPVIMTCNDEDLVPIQAMTLHAILRLSPVPSTIATDYMLLIAAKEGHLLARDAVHTLYESKGQDLRASIAELQLWCQMGVGDPRSGLGWIFPRWPKGTGIDEQGLPIRVTSKGTYQSGMGSLLYSSDSSSAASNEEEAVLQSWEDWGIDPRVRLFDQAEQKFCPYDVFTDRNDQLRALKDYECFSDAMSAMDMYGSVGLPGSIGIDTTDPTIPDKARSSYIAGLALLQTPQISDYDFMDTRLAVATTHLLSKVYNLPLDTSSEALISDITSPEPHLPLTRAAFTPALEPLAYNTSTASLGSSLSYTILDGPLKPIVVDVAPYVRSIAAYDLALELHRASMGLGDGGAAGPKKMRTTRAARSALEGGQRSLTRRERWFCGLDLDLGHVLQTGGDWPRLGGGEVRDEESKTEE